MSQRFAPDIARFTRRHMRLRRVSIDSISSTSLSHTMSFRPLFDSWRRCLALSIALVALAAAVVFSLPAQAQAGQRVCQNQ